MDEEQQSLTSGDYRGLLAIASGGPLEADPQVRKCLDIQRKLQAKRAEVEDLKAEAEALASKQDRLRANLDKVKEGEAAIQWTRQLAESEERLSEIEQQDLAGLRSDEQAIRRQLDQALAALSAKWAKQEA